MSGITAPVARPERLARGAVLVDRDPAVHLRPALDRPVGSAGKSTNTGPSGAGPRSSTS